MFWSFFLSLLLLLLSGFGLSFDGFVGDVNELFKFLFYEVVFLEFDEGKLLLSFVFDLFFLMLFSFGNFCIVIGDGVGDWNEELFGGGGGAVVFFVEYFWLVLVVVISVVIWLFEVDDDVGVVGMKKFVLVGIGGLVDFVSVDWNIVWEFLWFGL